jgi:hypothetical protein
MWTAEEGSGLIRLSPSPALTRLVQQGNFLDKRTSLADQSISIFILRLSAFVRREVQGGRYGADSAVSLQLIREKIQFTAFCLQRNSALLISMLVT